MNAAESASDSLARGLSSWGFRPAIETADAIGECRPEFARLPHALLVPRASRPQRIPGRDPGTSATSYPAVPGADHRPAPSPHRRPRRPDVSTNSVLRAQPHDSTCDRSACSAGSIPAHHAATRHTCSYVPAHSPVASSAAVSVECAPSPNPLLTQPARLRADPIPAQPRRLTPLSGRDAGTPSPANTTAPRVQAAIVTNRLMFRVWTPRRENRGSDVTRPDPAGIPVRGRAG